MPDEPDKEAHKPQDGNGYKPIEMTPMKLLAVILKAVLTERITDEEVDRICSTYYKTIQELWG